MNKSILSVLTLGTALATNALLAQGVTTSNTGQQFSVDVLDLPGGLTVNVQPDGRLVGSIEERSSVPGFPDEVDFSAYEVQINPDGSITGTFNGSDTFNVSDGNGAVTQQTENNAGAISGTIDQSGNYTVSWTGSEPGSVSGTLNGFSFPGSETPVVGSEGSVQNLPTFVGSTEIHKESAAEEAVQAVLGDVSVREASIVLRKIDDTTNFCRALEANYRIDCMAERYEFLARTLPKIEGGEVASDAFRNAAKKLRAIVAESEDTDAKRIMPRIRSKNLRVGSGRKLKAVKASSLRSANRKAEAVVEELSTVLLRSSENSDRRKAYFGLIAEAVDSNKLLLRS
jgi:hypothetical protein